MADVMNQLVDEIYSSYSSRQEDTRPHLGASVLGHECQRYLWLKFRWAAPSTTDGRVVRLLETGSLQEARLTADLRAVGATVSEVGPDGGQWAFQALGGHVGGSMDGAACGLPGTDPATWHVLEFKTMNDRAWKTLSSKGVRIAKPQHFSQIQLYMGWSEIARSLYLAVNKNDDSIYSEIVEFEQAEFDRLLAIAEFTLKRAQPAVPISDSPNSIPCKWCDFRGQCHGTDAPAVNCRTCVHATPELDGDARWSCAHHGRDLTIDEQRAACSSHRHIPALLVNIGELVACADTTLIYRNKLAPEREFQQPIFTSRDITECADKTTLGWDYEAREREAIIASAQPPPLGTTEPW